MLDFDSKNNHANEKTFQFITKYLTCQEMDIYA